MRNLKRALSLALAAIMVIGMMVIGAGAANLNDFPDKGDIVNQDAVSLLTTLGIINGKDNGNFDPKGDVTRAEMAKMISVVLNGGADNNALYADLNTKLTDISSSWAKGHINFCFSRNIITGRGNNTFDPTAKVTAAEAAKMLLVSAGYDPATEGFVGSNWSINVSAMASKLGIFKNFESGKLMSPLTRDDAALLIYNALDVEMIQKYENGYPIAFEDNRTILSFTYGVYKITGVVISNEYAALNGTDSDFASATGKTTMDNVKVYKSTTQNTTNSEYVEEKGNIIFNTTTTAEMLGKTVTMYARKTTVLANSEILGVYERDADNVVKTTAGNEDTAKDFLKGTGLAVDSDTQYYVNFGKMANEDAAQKALGLDPSTGRFSNVNGNINAYGIVMDMIDNDNDGKVEYVLYEQETLTQVVATNSNKETTTLNDFNKNKAIDNDKIVTEADLKEGTVVLAVSYGGRFYVAAPEVVTGKMDSFSSSKAKQQYIEVEGTKYYPSFIKYAADSVSNTYEFDILNCGKTDAVDFGISYDFIKDTNGNIIAYRPSEKGLYNFALILDSGYDPGRTNSNPTGEVKVLLADNTIATYTLDFGASAQNVGNQLHNITGSTASSRKSDGTVELKGFLGTSVTDNTTTSPVTGTTLNDNANRRYLSSDASPNKAGHAEGYVIAYSMNEDKVMTITSIVGTNTANGSGHYTPSVAASEKPYSIDGTVQTDYTNGAARVYYDADSKQLTIDQNTIAFYYTTTGGAKHDETLYGVTVGYSKMSDVKATTDFIAATLATNTAKDTKLATAVLFNCEGVVAEKDYAYVLGVSTSTSTAVTLNVVLTDGTASTLKISRSDFDSIFATDKDTAFNNVYSYTKPDSKGLSKLTIGTDNAAKAEGFVVKLRDGTLALYDVTSEKTVGSYKDAYSYDKNIWNVEDIKVGDNAPAGGFAQDIYKKAILITDPKNNTVRAAFIKGVLSGTTTDTDHDFNWELSNYKDAYPFNTVAEIQKMLTDGYNVKMNGDYVLTGNLYLPSGKIFYVTGSLNETAGNVQTSGKLWVQKDYTTLGNVSVETQVGGNMVLADATTIYSKVSVAGNITASVKNLTIAADANVYVKGNVAIGAKGDTSVLTVNGHIEATDYKAGSIVVNSSKTLVARGKVETSTLTVGAAGTAGTVKAAGGIDATNVTVNNGTMSVTGGTTTINALNTTKGTTVVLKDAEITTGTLSGNVKTEGTLTLKGAVTVDTTGTLSTGKVDSTAGSITNNGSFTTSDSTSTTKISGKLSGTYGGTVELGGDVTVASGTVINGELKATTHAIKLLGTLTLNNKVDTIATIGVADKITSASVIFGSNVIVKAVAKASDFVDGNGTAIAADTDASKNFAGKTFVYNSTSKKFVSTEKVATPDVTFEDGIVVKDKAFTVTPEGAGNMEIGVKLGKDQTMTCSSSDVKIEVAAAEPATAELATEVAFVATHTITVKVPATGAKVYTLVVAETGKTSITYTMTVNALPPLITKAVLSRVMNEGEWVAAPLWVTDGTAENPRAWSEVKDFIPTNPMLVLQTNVGKTPIDGVANDEATVKGITSVEFHVVNKDTKEDTVMTNPWTWEDGNRLPNGRCSAFINAVLADFEGQNKTGDSFKAGLTAGLGYDFYAVINWEGGSIKTNTVTISAMPTQSSTLPSAE